MVPQAPWQSEHKPDFNKQTMPTLRLPIPLYDAMGQLASPPVNEMTRIWEVWCTQSDSDHRTIELFTTITRFLTQVGGMNTWKYKDLWFLEPHLWDFLCPPDIFLYLNVISLTKANVLPKSICVGPDISLFQVPSPCPTETVKSSFKLLLYAQETS